MATANPEDFWRKTINHLTESSLPDNGKEAPQIESIPPPKRKGRSPKDGQRKVLVQKVVTEIYVFTDTEGKLFTSHAKQNLHILGEMTLEQGLKIAQEDNFS